MSSFIFSTKNDLKRTFLITDLEQGINHLTFDLESFGCDVTPLYIQDSTALQDALVSIDAIDLLVLFSSGKQDEEEYHKHLKLILSVFPKVKIILISKTFNMRNRLLAYSLGIKTYLLFPYDRFQLQTALLDAYEQDNKKVYKILLVDDHQKTACNTLSFLTEQGFELQVLNDPYLLPETVQAYDCDLLFLRLSAKHFCCQYLHVIKEIEAIKGVSIIVLSDKASCENEDNCLSTHADACLSSPYNPTAMIRLARIHARRSQAAKRNIRRFNAHYAEREREHNVLDIHALVSATDRFGRITYVNDNFCRTSGYSSQELLGNNHRIVKSGVHDAAVYHDIWGTISSGGVWTGEICNKRKDGSFYWVDSTIAAFLDDQGEVYQYISIRKDITHRKSVEKQLRQTIDILERTNEAARIGFWEYTLADKQLVWSNVTKDIHRVPENFRPTVDEAINFYRPGNNRERIQNLFARAVKEHIAYDTELVITSVHGEDIWVRTMGIPDLTGGECTRVYGLFQDITDKKHMMLSLVHAKEEAETANIAKSQFLSQMSHELRTPLNAILGFAQILQDSTSLNQEEMADVGEIYKAGLHLLNLINEVLDLSAVESGRLNFAYESVNIRDIVESCCQLLEPFALKHSIQMDYAIDETLAVKVDKSRFKQILLNLLSNAVKYNKDGGQIRISTHPAEQDMLRVRIEDTGTGLNVEQLRQLFKPFNRLGKEKEGIEGTGIGLALSKSLTELMGGKIGAESRLGEGSAFWIDFPKAHSATSKNRLKHEQSDTEASKSVVPSEDKQQKTILYVEDNPANLRLVENILASREHVRLLTASSPSTAIEIAFEQPIDLVLMDINLPEMSGFDLMALLTSEPALEFKSVPFVAVSADATKENIGKGLASGFTDYLTKPIDIKRFNAMIDRHLA